MQIIRCHRVPVLSPRPSLARCARTARSSHPLCFYLAPRIPGLHASHVALGTSPRALGAVPFCVTPLHSPAQSRLLLLRLARCARRSKSRAFAAPYPAPGTMRSTPLRSVLRIVPQVSSSAMWRYTITRLTSLRSREALRQAPCGPARSMPLRAPQSSRFSFVFRLYAVFLWRLCFLPLTRNSKQRAIAASVLNNTAPCARPPLRSGLTHRASHQCFCDVASFLPRALRHYARGRPRASLCVPLAPCR